MIIPITAAWFTGSMWYLGRQHSQDGFSPATPSSSVAPAIIHLGPAEERDQPIAAGKVDEQDPTIAAFNGATTVPFIPELTLRFVKNTQDLVLSEEEANWFESVRLHLLSIPETTVLITGYTDGDGDPAMNERLSLHRAQMVRDHLIEMGLPADRVQALGMGAAQPIADNLTSKGKALNRRVEIRVRDVQ